MTNYPGAIDEFRVTQNIPGVLYNADDTKTVFAEDTNNHSDAIVAIETELGTNPAGAFATVDSRLDNIDAAAQILHVADVGLRTYASGGYQPIYYNTVLADTSSGWDAANMQYTIPHDGAYFITAANWYTSAFAAGNKKLVIGLNGAEYQSKNSPQLGAYDTQDLSTGGYFVAGDIIKMFLYQDSGSNQTCDDYISTSFLKIIGLW